MNSVIRANIFRFIGLVLVQGLVLQYVGTGWEQFPYFHIIIYPIFVLLLPLRTPQPLVILLGFLTGLFVDMFYNTWGLHASALVFMAYMRSKILAFLEPRGGYKMHLSPTEAHMGTVWFLKYCAILLLLHLLFYFSVEAFTFVYIVDILLKTLVSYLVSMTFLIIYNTIFRPAI